MSWWDHISPGDPSQLTAPSCYKAQETIVPWNSPFHIIQRKILCLQQWLGSIAVNTTQNSGISKESVLHNSGLFAHSSQG